MAPEEGGDQAESWRQHVQQPEAVTVSGDTQLEDQAQACYAMVACL